jgi:hypothetical protein
MTLSPVFRSDAAVAVLRAEGVWDRIEEAATAQRDAIQRVRDDLPNVVDRAFVHERPVDVDRAVSLEFVQEFFFLIFFRSVLEAIGAGRRALDFYSELNFCITGTITAADNLFDDQDKMLLPLAAARGPRFRSIMQLLLFQRLVQRVLDRYVIEPETEVGLAADAARGLQRELLSRMAAIGTLEGSEETGVVAVLATEDMIDRVHRVRGGALFELGFVAPRLLEPAGRQDAVRRAQHAIARLGTAFQIVDDLTDFAFDLERGRHNLLVAQVHHSGTVAERKALSMLRESGHLPAGVVESLFGDSARAVLDRARQEANASLEELGGLGFWFPPGLADALVRAVVGLDGVDVMKALSS